MLGVSVHSAKCQVAGDMQGVRIGGISMVVLVMSLFVPRLFFSTMIHSSPVAAPKEKQRNLWFRAKTQSQERRALYVPALSPPNCAAT